MTVLDQILSDKRAEVALAKAAVPPRDMERIARSREEPTRGFRAALRSGPPPRVIAEIKRRSPSRGEIRADFDLVACAKAYAEHGAAAISVLTDERHFGGHLEYLDLVRNHVTLPLLRKDFVVDAYQIDEARAHGADAVLLIVAAFEGPERVARLRELSDRARSQSLDVLVEVHDEEELDVALAVGVDLLGINNRNLKTFETDLGVTERLVARIPDSRREGLVIVGESGIADAADVQRLERAGTNAFLVGESLMREKDLGAALTRLLAVDRVESGQVRAEMRRRTS